MLSLGFCEVVNVMVLMLISTVTIVTIGATSVKSVKFEHERYSDAISFSSALFVGTGRRGGVRVSQGRGRLRYR